MTVRVDRTATVDFLGWVIAACSLGCSIVDRTATVDFLGWVIAACSLGCSIVGKPTFRAMESENNVNQGPRRRRHDNDDNRFVVCHGDWNRM
ncbi:hypothetical protein COOONC_13451 [Cooperia oncophora]